MEKPMASSSGPTHCRGWFVVRFGLCRLCTCNKSAAAGFFVSQYAPTLERTCRHVMATGTGGVTPSTSCSSKSSTKASSEAAEPPPLLLLLELLLFGPSRR